MATVKLANLTSAMDDDEYDVEEERRIAFTRLINRKSPIVYAAVQKTLAMLNRIHICKPTYILRGGIATVFFRFNEKCSVTFVHQSSSGVMVTFAKNNVVLGDPLGILWAPGRDPWVITYLIAGYYRIEQAVYDLHFQTGLFCKYGHMRRCEICNNLKFTETAPWTKMNFRLTPLWDEDDPERVSKICQTLAKTHIPRPRVGKLYTS